MYKSIIRPLLFQFNAESAHNITFKLTKFFLSLPLAKTIVRKNLLMEDKSLERELFGIKFPNPVGLAAGFDKDAKMIDEFACFGFGFLEIGTLTPKAQAGNPKPRLFRLQQDSAIINRMGFNNAGLESAIGRLKKRKTKLIIGGNIGKNKITPNENAVDDYLASFNALHEYVDYFVVNVSSPNTPNLRALQEKGPLLSILNTLQEANKSYKNQKPILLKIAPDLNESQLDDIIEIVLESKISGLIATNTTIDRSNLSTEDESVDAIGAGGLSGKPLSKRSTAVIRYISEKTNGTLPIIGVGGIMSAQDALEKLQAGASLVQLYTGFIYEGPALIKRINKSIIEKHSH